VELPADEDGTLPLIRTLRRLRLSKGDCLAVALFLFIASLRPIRRENPLNEAV
jgi:hypothetical protein